MSLFKPAFIPASKMKIELLAELTVGNSRFLCELWHVSPSCTEILKRFRVNKPDCLYLQQHTCRPC